jgi:hypothetical protein
VDTERERSKQHHLSGKSHDSPSLTQTTSDCRTMHVGEMQNHQESQEQ